MSSFLPHLDPEPEFRKLDLSQARSEFQYDYDTFVSPLAVAKKVPKGQGFAARWLLKVADRGLKLLANRAEKESDSKKRQALADKHKELVRDVARGGNVDIRGKLLTTLTESIRDAVMEKPRSLDEYADMFRVIGLPPISKNFQEDQVFASMRVAGPNPLMIERVTELPDHFPLTAATYAEVMPGDSLAAAAQEGRLYLADYQALDKAVDGEFSGEKKFLYAPLALFAVEKVTKDLLPVAIQCDQTPSTDNPIYTPNDSFNWLIAKTIVEVADGNFHEAVSHLGRTHMFIEPFVMATYRQLSSKHPVFLLLTPHFKGTIAINNSAVNSLIAPGGVVDEVMGPKIESVWKLTVEGVQSYLFDDVMLPKTFAKRGVDDSEILPNYPYRDDSMLYWDAIHEWVTSYLAVYYRSDSDVQNDKELTNWFNELVSQNGGRVQGLGKDGNTGSLSYLADAATLIIFTSSVQHAAVNFPQYDLMSYVPNMPGACYRPRPTQLGGATEQDFLSTLPPIPQAQKQMEFLYFLGTIHYTCLGKYGRWHFRDRAVKEPLKTFKDRIDTINDVIKTRNKTERREQPYKFLIPKGVPQSINI